MPDMTVTTLTYHIQKTYARTMVPASDTRGGRSDMWGSYNIINSEMVFYL